MILTVALEPNYCLNLGKKQCTGIKAKVFHMYNDPSEVTCQGKGADFTVSRRKSAQEDHTKKMKLQIMKHNSVSCSFVHRGEKKMTSWIYRIFFADFCFTRDTSVYYPNFSSC